ncbi:ABC transporter ATPase [Corynebacterium suranareeae]|uniref:Mycobactin import ATP-binding/permease protein IrtA n=1 Tax=Corynebacterium suranareeae TaxID=2506452 RepID=A0A160PQP9_9CORY|nr:ABC transporter ATP-binding protein/permease [Corynebacterium suranareeae]BAU96447.1 ABC transporter ATPase [Corynebacterium suranareeae]
MAKRGINGAIMRAYGAQDHDAEVIRTHLISPGYLRVYFHSDTLLEDDIVAPAAALRFWFPDPQREDFEHQRGYTIVEGDATTGIFAIDFVLHEPSGPASSWAKTAQPGMTVKVTPFGSTRFDLPDHLPAGYLLIGDSASIPAINGILKTVPPEIPIELYLEEHLETDQLIPLVEHPRARVHWVPRQGEASLAASIESRDWSNWYVWATPESGSLKQLRARLKGEFGFPRSETHAQAYWYYGRAFGSNRSKAQPEVVPEDRTTIKPVASAAPVTEVSQGTWRSQAGTRLIAPLKSTLIIAGVAQVLITLIQLVPYVLLVELARLLLTGAESSALWTVGQWAIGVMVGGAILASLLIWWLHSIDARFSRDLRQRLLKKMSRLPLGWFNSHGSGRVKQLVQDDTLSLHFLVTHAVPDAVAAATAPIAVLIYLFVVDWRIALVLFVPVLAYIFGMAVMIAQSGSKTSQAMKWSEQMNVEAGAYIEGQPVIRIFGGAAASTFRTKLGQYIEFLRSWQQPMIGQKTFIDLVTRPGTFLFLISLMGTVLITTGAMSPIDILPFLFLGTTFGARLLGVGYGLSGLRAGLLAARNIQNTLDETELDTPPATNEDTQQSTAQGLVEFKEVNFSYRYGIPVLENINLTLRPGSVTALVGASGSGKSTLAALLARFYDVDSGAILINGKDIRTMSPDELYTHVGFVFQQTQLIQGTVRDNIALADPDASFERIEHAARAAQIHERIMRMPKGYDTDINADAALSGGEKQRLTIARALLANTPILVLDEATAFADPESEYLVQQALNKLIAGRTVVVIAHRLHTITSVDNIVVLDQGKIAESGTHGELLQADGRYRQLWNANQDHREHHS